VETWKRLTALAALSILGACAGAAQNSAGTIPSSSSQSRALLAFERSGADPKYFGTLRLGESARAAEHPSYAGLHDLYVTAYGGSTLDILKNKTYKQVGGISNGLDGADGDFLDLQGNLYVANWTGVTITEYAPGGESPSFTYSASMTDPVDVSVDTHQNVYDADYSGSAVNEYAQQSNALAESCEPGGEVEGVAADKRGDVFVSYNIYTTEVTGAQIAEYKGGLAGCSETVFPLELAFAGGMVLDDKGDLVVCDQGNAVVDVIPPPYTSVARTIGSGLADPFHVTLSKDNKLAFVTDLSNDDVEVINYRTGNVIKTLGASQGLTDPAGAVDGPNAVY
jgi:DNA-binding beta-propeller fold protein YncE